MSTTISTNKYLNTLFDGSLILQCHNIELLPLFLGKCALLPLDLSQILILKLQLCLLFGLVTYPLSDNYTVNNILYHMSIGTIVQDPGEEPHAVKILGVYLCCSSIPNRLTKFDSTTCLSNLVSSDMLLPLKVLHEFSCHLLILLLLTP